MNDQFLQGVLFDWNRIDNDSYLTKYNKNSPSSIGGRWIVDLSINAQKNFVNKKGKHLFWWLVCIMIEEEHIVQKTIIEFIYLYVGIRWGK